MRYVLLLSIALISLVTHQSAIAQEDEVRLEEIVVTATRRSQSLQEVGIAGTR